LFDDYTTIDNNTSFMISSATYMSPFHCASMLRASLLVER